ncbi:hypothetical protein KDI_01940 [Dictyobacter arantiisoli]|uniref:Uncharacterized protein n=1 Tax=Dictyobacter arantiisoli TaxID=2014874 RepID=A0A5A5T5F1_9CHLR|nr:hypothetical protein KDI_01940 [Dictyobacter arantiisoli]
MIELLKGLTEQIDTTTPGGKLIFHLMGALAEKDRKPDAIVLFPFAFSLALERQAYSLHSLHLN